MNMHRTHSLALAALAAALTLSALACRPETNAPATAAPEVVTVEVTRLVAPGETAAPPLPIATVAATAEVAPPPAVVTVEVTRPALGTAERPVQLLFPPTTAGAVIAQRAEPLVAALEAATGAEFAVGVPDDEAAVAALLCAAPGDTIGFISAAAYTLAHDECDAVAGLVARHDDGLTWQMGMLVTRPGAAAGLADLAGRRWAVADTRSLPTYLYFRAQMAEAGIEPGEVVTQPEETSALLALRNDEVDFTTAVFIPPVMPLDRQWVFGETDAEEWRVLGIPPTRSPIGYVLVAGEPEFGGYRLRDARARLFDTTPDIFDVTRVLALSQPIPNETVVFGADFPLLLARQTLATMAEFAASETCQSSLCSADFYGWTGLEPADDAAYDPIRFIQNTLELEAADLWAELD
ncbi:MAG: PhnD/SsuA/transferrin family substrate-binding protein [Candidatus Promineofilum sp.]|nr:PhnD/SsuA/transferrin family substrate-binding protein [Promineifilum sp.]